VLEVFRGGQANVEAATEEFALGMTGANKGEQCRCRHHWSSIRRLGLKELFLIKVTGDCMRLHVRVGVQQSDTGYQQGIISRGWTAVARVAGYKTGLCLLP
jgi:hypothetical protein